MDENVVDLVKNVSELVGLIKGTNGDGIVFRFNRLEMRFYDFLAAREASCPMSKELTNLYKKLDEIERENRDEHKNIMTEIESLKDKPGANAKRAWSKFRDIVVGVVVAALTAILILLLTGVVSERKETGKDATHIEQTK